LALAAPAVGAAAASHYVVAPNDTLFSIARRFHVPLSLLAQVNGIHDLSRIRVGDVLVIPDVPAAIAEGPVAAVPTAAPRTVFPSRQGPSGVMPQAAPAGLGESYFVQPGDTLYHLALTHGTTVDALETANALTSPAIIVGQVLRLPRPAAAAPAPVTHAPVPSAGGLAAGQHEINADPTSPDATVPGGVTAPSEPAVHSVTPARAALAARVRSSALGYLGTPYVWGGTTPSGVDCSGLVYLVYSPYVANLPRTSYDQWAAGVAVGRAELAPGDLVFFNTDGSGASHVGIYIGDGQFVHPAASTQRVVVDRLDAAYYVIHYLGARRII
ncbi:MAG TPA: NlpC/P60 family protein, partial [bacterium]|nr:NlpC/P60 family protein [bacterium]